VCLLRGTDGIFKYNSELLPVTLTGIIWPAFRVFGNAVLIASISRGVLLLLLLSKTLTVPLIEKHTCLQTHIQAPYVFVSSCHT
jgi:hypothetical protein